MLPIYKETHWVYKTAYITRIGWFIFHLIVLIFFLNTMPYFWLVLPLFFAAFLLPQWAGSEKNCFGVKYYPFIELGLSGLFLIVGCYLLGEYSSFLAYPALCAGIYSIGKDRWYLLVGFSLIPFLAVAVIGLEHLGMGVIDGLFFFSVGVAIAKVLESERKTQLLLDENLRQNQLLEEYARQIEKVTLLEERNRLARDLHDTIGHTYTSVIMGLDATSILLKTAPVQAEEHVHRLSEVMRDSLEEIRSHIHQIAPVEDKEELSAQLKRIASEFAQHTRTDIEFDSIDQVNVNISSQGTVTLVRCLQESLTNAIRHGQASQIKITIYVENQSLKLVIKDNGIGIQEKDYGFGLLGMKERLESLQGRLTIESSQHGGTCVNCYVPVIDYVQRRIEHNDKSANCG
ncbi:sensor histidine kinase [Bacillus suaedae]|uniref:histidine kinase n=1 Tax=Halalkalibacter suaedae TaxID=2822140 RepID=A0A940WPC7_9BACI|nr:sensor histidine kinase [Bacillus suaedae]MBP3950179.1 sensor histidine kinase [Bacillus suaedae]